MRRRNQIQHRHSLDVCFWSRSDSTANLAEFLSAKSLVLSNVAVSFLMMSPAAIVWSFNARVKCNISSAICSWASWWAWSNSLSSESLLLPTFLCRKSAKVFWFLTSELNDRIVTSSFNLTCFTWAKKISSIVQDTPLNSLLSNFLGFYSFIAKCFRQQTWAKSTNFGQNVTQISSVLRWILLSRDTMTTNENSVVLGDTKLRQI